MSKRKYVLLILVFILAIVAVGVVAVIIRNNSIEVKPFNVDEYQEYIEKYPSDETVGNVDDEKDLVKKAEAILIEKYGNQIKKQKPYKVFYDETNDVWMVTGTLPSNMKGGVANIIIDNSTGKVLAVWHGE